MARVTQSGIELFYDDVGEGREVLLFIPGFGGIGSFWEAQIEHFRDRHRVITVDHRGMGQSSRFLGEYSIEQMATDVISVMEHADVACATLIGHSTGGAIAQMLGAAWPQRVARLVLSSTWCEPGNYFRRLFEFRRTLLERGDLDGYHKVGMFFRYTPDYLDEHDLAFDTTPAVDVEITVRRIDAILRSDLRAQAAAIRAPTLVIATRDDRLVPMFLSDEVASTVPGARYHVFEKGGHFHPKTECRTFNAALTSFLGSSRDASVA